jgi:hypothetical protein
MGVMVESNAVPGFLPSTNGLHFRNSFPSGPTVKLGPLDPRWIGIGDASAGLCGGMSWYVRERFVAGLPTPPDTDPPANGSPLFQTLVRDQVQSLEYLQVPLRFYQMSALGHDGAARRTRDTEWPKVRADIDAKRLVMLGLLRKSGWNPFNLTANHQVLAYGYSVDGDTVTLRVCDPNWPSADGVTITIGPAGLTQSTGEPLDGALDLG